MSLFNTFSLVVTRYNSIATSFGRHDPSSDVTSTVNIKGSVQPLDGNTMETLPENKRELETYRLYTKTQLFTTREVGGSKLKADQVEIFGKTFEVIRVEPWQNSLISHYKAIVSRIDGNP